MAYTAAIDEATPLGADNAATADDQLRALKLAIKERLNSFFVSYNTDPLTINNGRIDPAGSLQFQDSTATWYAGIRPAPSLNGVLIGNGNVLSAMIDSRTTLLAAHIDNNNKLYFLTGYGLVIHYNSQRYSVDLTLIP